MTLAMLLENMRPRALRLPTRKLANGVGSRNFASYFLPNGDPRGSRSTPTLRLGLASSARANGPRPASSAPSRVRCLTSLCPTPS